MIEHKNIHEAINAVMEEVGYVKKSRSTGVNYSFAGESALIAALRPAMVEHGIYMHVSKIENVVRENVTTKSGSQMVNTLTTGVVRFTHTQSGTSIDSAATGEGFDSGDKSANKAMTGLYKYAMRQTFCIETGDDPDTFSAERKAPVTAKPAPSVKSPQSSTAAPAKKEEVTLPKVANEIITVAEWEAFQTLITLADSKNITHPDYERAKMTPEKLTGAKNYINQELKKKEGK